MYAATKAYHHSGTHDPRRARRAANRSDAIERRDPQRPPEAAHYVRKHKEEPKHLRDAHDVVVHVHLLDNLCEPQ